MDIRSALPGLRELQGDTLGDSQVCIAVLDGPVDLSHPCFDGATLQRIDTLAQEPASSGRMSTHGTHVTSLLFGQPGSPIVGIAPKCRGLIVPIFRDEEPGPVSQLDLARAIEQAVQAGAHIISVSGGEHSPTGQADDMLDRVLRVCDDDDIMVVAAVGNDSCACLQVPAAVPSVLAVGAIGMDGKPLASNNWGAPYLKNGVLAPGQSIDGAAPGGGITALTGTSFATPLVAGVAALLLSLQRKAAGHEEGAREIRDAILKTARPCQPRNSEQCRQYLAGILDVAGAHDFVQRGGTRKVPSLDDVSVAAESAHSRVVTNAQVPVEQPAGVGAAAIGLVPPPDPGTTAHGTSEHQHPPLVAGGPDDGQPGTTAAFNNLQQHAARPVAAGYPATPGVVAAGNCGCGGAGTPQLTSGVVTAGNCGCGGAGTPQFTSGVAAAANCGCDGGQGAPQSLIYAIGKIGIDFGTDAQRDAFRQQMGSVPTTILDEEQSPPSSVFSTVPANPYNPIQLSNYLKSNPWESNKLIWTLNLERTPIYALEAEVPYGLDWTQFQLDDQGQVQLDKQGRPLPDLYYPPVSPVYKLFRDAFVGHHLDPDRNKNYISMVSIPGILTNRTVRLFSGQVVPVVKAQAQSMYSWNEPELVAAAVNAVQEDAERQRRVGRAAPAVDDLTVRQNVRAFLDKVYFQFRNLGQSPPDRALNYAATNAFMVADTLREGLTSGTYVPGENAGLYSLDTIGVSKSPFCRPGSDCWDVQLTFFDPEDKDRARVTYLFTIDVSYVVPVSLAPSHRFLVGTPQLTGAWR